MRTNQYGYIWVAGKWLVAYENGEVYKICTFLYISDLILYLNQIPNNGLIETNELGVSEFDFICPLV